MAAVRARGLHVAHVLVEPAVGIDKVFAPLAVGGQVGADLAPEPGVREVVPPELVRQGAGEGVREKAAAAEASERQRHGARWTGRRRGFRDGPEETVAVAW